MHKSKISCLKIWYFLIFLRIPYIATDHPFQLDIFKNIDFPLQNDQHTLLKTEKQYKRPQWTTVCHFIERDKSVFRLEASHFSKHLNSTCTGAGKYLLFHIIPQFLMAKNVIYSFACPLGAKILDKSHYLKFLKFFHALDSGYFLFFI